MLPVDYTTLFNSYSFNLVEIVSGWAQRRRWFAAFQNAVTRQICEHWGEEVAIAPAFVPKCILYMYTYIQIYIYGMKENNRLHLRFCKMQQQQQSQLQKLQHRGYILYTLVEFRIKWIHWSSLCRLFYLHNVRMWARARALSLMHQAHAHSPKCPFIWHLVWFTNVCEWVLCDIVLREYSSSII